MKKVFYPIAALLFAAVAFSSCNKEQGNTPVEQSSELKTYTLTIEVAKNPDTKQLVLDGTGKTLNAVWAEGEEVSVLAGEPKVKIGTLSPTTFGTASTVLTGTVTVAGLGADSWVDLVFGGDLTSQDGSLANICDWAKAWFQVDRIDGTTIVPKASSGTADGEGKVLFNNWTSIVRFIVKSGSDDLPVSKMVIKTADGYPIGSGDKELTITPASDTNVLYASLSNYSGDTPIEDDYEIIVTASNGSIYSCRATDKTFERGHFYSVTLKVSPDTFTVVGEPLAVLPGDSTWDLDESANNLVFNPSTGLYSKTFTVPAATTSVTFKVVRNYAYANGSWPGDDYSVSDIKAGYEASLTINYNPATNAVTHSLEYTSPYRLYVQQDGLAAAASTKWGSSRSVWDAYDFIQLADVDSKKCFMIPDAIVDDKEQDLYFKGENECEVKLTFTPSSGTESYSYKTNGFEIIPIASSYTAEKRIWACIGSVSVLKMHVWGSNNFNTGDWDWDNMMAMSPSNAKFDGKTWFYYTIPAGNDTANIIFVWNSADNQTNNIEDVDLSSSVYYKINGHRNHELLTW